MVNMLHTTIYMVSHTKIILKGIGIYVTESVSATQWPKVGWTNIGSMYSPEYKSIPPERNRLVFRARQCIVFAGVQPRPPTPDASCRDLWSYGNNTATQEQTGVTAHFSSKQSPLLVFAEQNCLIDSLLTCPSIVILFCCKLKHFVSFLPNLPNHQQLEIEGNPHPLSSRRGTRS